jgi:flagellar biogenesis protein FliO
MIWILSTLMFIILGLVLLVLYLLEKLEQVTKGYADASFRLLFNRVTKNEVSKDAKD